MLNQVLLLRTVDGDRKGKAVVVDETDEVIFGREDDCFEVLCREDLTIGRHHFAIRPSPKGFLLIDLGSRNSTILNEHRIPRKKPARLSQGDRISAGKSTFEVHLLGVATCSECGDAIPELLQFQADAPWGKALCRNCSATGKLSPPKASKSRSRVAPTQIVPAGKSHRAAAARQPSPPTPLISEPWQVFGSDYSLVNTLKQSKVDSTLIVKKASQKGMLVLKQLRLGTSEEVPTVVTDYLQRIGSQNNETLGRWQQIKMVDGQIVALRRYYLSDVSRLLANSGGRLQFHEAFPVIQSVLHGLKALHSAGLAHGHLVPCNLMTADGSKTPRLQMVDFGFSDALRLARAEADDKEATVPERNSTLMSADVASAARLLCFLLTGEEVPQDTGAAVRFLRKVKFLPTLAETLRTILRGDSQPTVDEFFEQVETAGRRAVRLTVRL